MTYVLDACALIALIKGEEGAIAVQNFIDQAIDGEITNVNNLRETKKRKEDKMEIKGARMKKNWK
jgi:PIN domain nuclease of toxin-antitoxin system